MDDPDFYKEKSEKEQDAIAWAIAWKQHNKNKKSKKKSFNMKEYRTAKNQTS